MRREHAQGTRRYMNALRELQFQDEKLEHYSSTLMRNVILTVLLFWLITPYYSYFLSQN